MASRIAFTLPISCQICLGQVKDPVVCSNQHVFCKECIDIWLERNPQCPACRVPISSECPYRAVLGGLNPNIGIDKEQVSGRELRRSRIELLYKDYENEIEHLQVEIDRQNAEILALRQQCAAVETSNIARSTFNDPVSSINTDTSVLVVTLQNRLKESVSLYKGVKGELERRKKECMKFKDDIVALERENEKLKLDLVNRSPRRFGRYTVSALENMVQNSDKEIQQLNRALEKSDAHIADLEEQLTSCRKQCQSSGEIIRGQSYVCQNCHEITDSLIEPSASRDTSMASIADPLSVLNSTISQVDFQVAWDSNIDRIERTTEGRAPKSPTSFALDVPSADFSTSEREKDSSIYGSFLKPNNIGTTGETPLRSVLSSNAAFNFERPSELLDRTGSTDQLSSDGIDFNRRERKVISSSSNRPDFSLPSPICGDELCSLESSYGGSSCKKKLRFMMPEEDMCSRNKVDRSKIVTSRSCATVESHQVPPTVAFFKFSESKSSASCANGFLPQSLVSSTLVPAKLSGSLGQFRSGLTSNAKVDLGKSKLNIRDSIRAGIDVEGRRAGDSSECNGVDMVSSLTPEIQDCFRLMNEAEAKVKQRKNDLFLDCQF